MNKKTRFLELYKLMANTPSLVIDMDTWRSNENYGDPTDEELAAAVEKVAETKTACGTTACALGFACSAPVFREEGLVWGEKNGEFFPTFAKDDFLYTGFDAAIQFFGISEDRAGRLFGTITDVEYDADMTSKQAFLRRLRKYLLKKGYIDKTEFYRMQYEEAKADQAEGVEVF